MVVLATSNPGKLREVGEILAALPMRLVGLTGLAGVALPAEGDDYTANAVGKALAAARASGHLALGDDSGLEVDALGGAPGPRSARFGGPGLGDAARNRLLLSALVGVPSPRRGARFVCVAALATAEGEVETACGACTGRILEAPRGIGGFGYDPIFEVEARGRSMAELEPREKHEASHRGRAFRAIAGALRARLPGAGASGRASP